LSEKWVWKKTDESSEGKVVKWVGPAQYEDKTTKTLMMLPTDYSLVQVRTKHSDPDVNEIRIKPSRNGSIRTPPTRRNSLTTFPPPFRNYLNWAFPSKV
jgi:hypothetical protein